MRKLLAMLAAALLFALPTSAGAISGGEEDTGNAYPFVGMLAFYDEADDYLWRCTGTLLSPTLVLTASHCTDGTDTARAYFQVEVTDDFREDPSEGITGWTYTHPDFNPRTLTNDVAVVVLDTPLDLGEYPELPSEGLLSQMKRDHEIQDDWFVAVGYGGVPSFPPSVITFDDYVRRVAETPYGSLTRNNLHLQQNPNPTGAGGTCFGDSGGPHFWEDELLLVSVTSWGDAICRSNDMTQRVDLPAVLDWLDGFLDSA
jgi:secreted trypsin-like serine protease